jgi:RNA recognition motif-containing protein
LKFYIYQFYLFFFQERKAEAKAVKRKIDSIKRRRRSRKGFKRGIVYIGHIPHGFYEEQMNEYFQQFGTVTRVRVSRSKKVCISLNKCRAILWIFHLYIL